MKLLFVIDNLGSGGAQRQIVNLAIGLKARGHEVTFFTYYPSDHFRPLLDESEIPVLFQRKRNRFSSVPIYALRRTLILEKYDIALAFLATPSFYTEIASLGLKKTKVVVSERFMYPPGKIPANIKYLQELHRVADTITVNSHHQRERMIKEFPWMARKTKTIYNGYNLDIFTPAVSAIKHNNKLELLAIASVSFKKNSLNLAKAIGICRDKHKINVCINWVGNENVSGEGPQPMQQTNNYLNELGLGRQWNWLGKRFDIPQLLAAHNALIHTSFFEGLPNAVCEALACGRPVMASNVCDHPLLIKEGTTGFLFDPHSPESIASTILTFSRLNQTGRTQMGKAARVFAEKHLSLNRFVDDYENLFISLKEVRNGDLGVKIEDD